MTLHIILRKYLVLLPVMECKQQVLLPVMAFEQALEAMQVQYSQSSTVQDANANRHRLESASKCSNASKGGFASRHVIWTYFVDGKLCVACCPVFSHAVVSPEEQEQ